MPSKKTSASRPRDCAQATGIIFAKNLFAGGYFYPIQCGPGDGTENGFEHDDVDGAQRSMVGMATASNGRGVPAVFGMPRKRRDEVQQ